MVPSVTPPIVHPFEDLGAAARALASLVVRTGRRSLEVRGRFSLALSGGSSPVPLFRSLADEHRADLPWERVDFLWADERAVPPGDPESNFGLAERELLSPLSIPTARIHRVRGEIQPEEAAADYETRVRALLPDGALDLALLGMGPDGHTASLFPGSPLLSDASRRWIAIEAHPGQPPKVTRVTMTLEMLNRTRSVAFLVAGAEKRAALPITPAGSTARPVVPAGMVHGTESTAWFVDRAAYPAP